MTYHEKSTDQELLQGCRDQHPLAQKYLYQRYFGKLLGISMRYTSNRSEAIEVLNTAFLKIFDSILQYRESGTFGGWMSRIVFHASIDYIRSRSSYRKVMDYSTEADQPIYNEVVGRLEAEDLFKLIQQLPPATRSVFSLYVIEGYIHREIADMLGIDEGTSKWHLSQARRLLQEKISTQHQISGM